MKAHSDVRSWDVVLLDWTEHAVGDPHQLRDELVRRGLRAKFLTRPFPSEEMDWVFKALEDAAYVLDLHTEASRDRQKERTGFDGRPMIHRRPKGHVPDPAEFDPDVGGEEHGILEEDGSVLVERLTLWVKAWNR